MTSFTLAFVLVFTSMPFLTVVQCRRRFGNIFHVSIHEIHHLQHQLGELKQKNKEQDTVLKNLKDLTSSMQVAIQNLQKCCSSVTTTPYSSTPEYSTTAVPRDFEGTTATEFAIMFQEPPPYDPIYLQILIASDRAGSVTLEDKLSGSNSVTPVIRGLNVLNVSSSHIGKGNEIANKGMLLQSTFPITVYGMYRSKFSAEGFNAIPTSALGTKYMVMNYFNGSLSYGPKGYKIMIVAVNDSTVVSIKFNLTSSTSAIQLFGNNYGTGETFTTTIGRLSTLHIHHPTDLSGTVVTSDKPIAVTSGGRCDWVIQTPVNCQPNFEFLSPTDSWGTKFVVPAISQTPHYVLKVLSLLDMTVIRITSGETVSTHTLMADKFFEIVTSNEAMLIVSNNPIYVVLYTETTRSMGTIMVTIPADTQYANSFDLGFLDQEKVSSFVCIAIKSEQLDGLRIDEQNVTYTPANRTDITFYGQSYTSLTIQVFNSFHKISHINPEVRFGGVIYGFYKFDGRVRAFGYPAGLRLPSADYV